MPAPVEVHASREENKGECSHGQEVFSPEAGTLLEVV